MAASLPSKGLFGWLGRQVGHVRKAVRTDPTRKVVFRQNKVEEAPMPEKPGVTLRRTVIDEVIVDGKARITKPEPGKARITKPE